MTATGRFHQQLLDTASYPEVTQAVDFKETHISRIYLTDNHAYKLKKPRNLGFLDFSTLEKRHHFCHEEVRLNRRFTTDIYLGVVTLRQQNGRVCFGKRGKLLDYAVQMRRLPENRMLSRLIEVDSPELHKAMPQLGTALQALMEHSEVCRDEQQRNVDVVKQNCAENFFQTRAAIGSALTEEAHSLMQRLTRQKLSALEETMLDREAQGYVRDGHGDLHTANICMSEPICIYDCIEFNRRFRIADIIADLAFLVMDLEFLGRRDLAEKLVSYCRAYAGDQAVALLLPFYKSYRAWVRGKVDAMLAVDRLADVATRGQAASLARRYFNLALGYQLEPALFLTSGLMGVGKTTLARSLCEATGAVHLRSDVVRKQLVGLPELQAAADDFGIGLYSRHMTERTYAELFATTAELLSRKQSVVVDASFAGDDERAGFIGLARQKGCPVWLLRLECPDDVALHRLDQRSEDASDGRRELFAAQKATFSQAALSKHVLVVDTARPVDYNVQSILCRALTGQERLS